MRKKGQLTIAIGTAISIASIVVGGLTAYYTKIGVQADVISEAKIDLKEDISQDRQEIAALKEAVITIKADNAEVKRDVKEILRLLK